MKKRLAILLLLLLPQGCQKSEQVQKRSSAAQTTDSHSSTTNSSSTTVSDENNGVVSDEDNAVVSDEHDAVENSIGIKFVTIPPLPGSEPEPLFMSAFEVTQSQYEEIMGDFKFGDFGGTRATKELEIRKGPEALKTEWWDVWVP